MGLCIDTMRNFKCAYKCRGVLRKCKCLDKCRDALKNWKFSDKCTDGHVGRYLQQDISANTAFSICYGDKVFSICCGICIDGRENRRIFRCFHR